MTFYFWLFDLKDHLFCSASRIQKKTSLLMTLLNSFIQNKKWIHNSFWLPEWHLNYLILQKCFSFCIKCNIKLWTFFYLLIGTVLEVFHVGCIKRNCHLLKEKPFKPEIWDIKKLEDRKKFFNEQKNFLKDKKEILYLRS